MEKAIFHRTQLLFGEDRMAQLANKKIIILGIGGVGSWCAESLIRTGISNITLVDSDRVCITNVNRQIQATTKTVGQVKTEALKNRLLEINPHANIHCIQKIFNRDNSHEFNFSEYDYVIDAIDSLSSKVHLLEIATKTKAKVYSSMGASLKVDPTRIKVAEFWEVKGCPLGSKVRKMMRQHKRLPSNKIICVYSDEVLPNNEYAAPACGSEKCMCPKSETGPGNPELVNHEWCSKKAVINGTTAHITAIFGFTIAGLIIQSIYENQ